MDDWAEAVPATGAPAWDPAVFADDDGRLYVYHGSSNAFPLYGQELDRRTFRPIGERRGLIKLRDDVHGGSGFGEGHDNTFLRPFLEGGRDDQAPRPVLPPVRRARHGIQRLRRRRLRRRRGRSDRSRTKATTRSRSSPAASPAARPRVDIQGRTRQLVARRATIAIGVKNNFERRIGIWPAGFDDDGVLYCNTAYGDYPTIAPPPPARPCHRRRRLRRRRRGGAVDHRARSSPAGCC